MGIDRSRYAKRNRRELTRGANGQLRAASDDSDIGDIWAQQRRLELNQAIADDRRRAELRRLRRERGLIGLATIQLANAMAKIRSELFGAKKRPPTNQPVRQSATPTPIARKGSVDTGTKNVEIIIAMPALSAGSIARSLRQVYASLIVNPLRSLRRSPRTAISAIAVVLVASGLAGFLVTDYGTTKDGDVQGTATTASGPATLERGTPGYRTLLPAGKDIGSLGGWTRVSPPDRDPVYAYVDKIDGIQINVSQQPLPNDLKSKSEDKMEQLAKAYGAIQKVTISGMTVHIGTSAKGPQSVIFSRDDLLILIKSSAPITTDSWTKYISSLK